MKRTSDDDTSFGSGPGSQFKRARRSSCEDSCAQPQVIEGGVAGGSSGGPGCGGDGAISQKLMKNYALSYLKEVKEVFHDQREKYMFFEIMKDFKAGRIDRAGIITSVKELFKGHKHLILGFNTFLPRGCQIKLEDEVQKTVDFKEAVTFVNEIKRRFQHAEHVYISFLDILNMYRNEGNVISEVVYKEVASLFEGHPDLLAAFIRFLPGSSATPLIQNALNGRQSSMALLRQQTQARQDILMTCPDRDRSVDCGDVNGDKRTRETNKEQRKPQKKSVKNADDFGLTAELAYKDKDAVKSIYAFSCCEEVKEKLTSSDDYQSFVKCTPSYRLLPEDYPIPMASQRSKLDAQVLNNHCVSVASQTQDYSFKHVCRNEYEESLFRYEDDRFELDMLLESVSSAIKRADELYNTINENKINMEAPFHIEEHFSTQNLRCIERLYGDHGLEVIDMLSKNPILWLPVILTRLKQKQEEWSRCCSHLNEVWVEINAQNHYRSLDHRA